jgi:hypothetical protein
MRDASKNLLATVSRALAVASCAALPLALTACSEAKMVSLAVAPDCNPLGLVHCMTPWPSSVFETSEPGAPHIRRLAIPDGALLVTTQGVRIDPAGWNVADGFSPAAPMVMAWKGGVSPEGLPTQDDFERSLTADSPTVIIDMTTQQRVAHFAEVDAYAADQPDSQALILRPATRLIGGHDYAVGITRRVRARDGSELVRPPGYAALIDNTFTDHAALERVRSRLPALHDAFSVHGIAIEELVVAWEFRVASDDFLHRDLIAARDRALAALDDHPIAFAITSDAPVGDGSVIRRQISGTLDAPLFLTQGGAAAVGTKVARDEAGLPALQGFYQIPFTAIVPTCALTAPAPVAMVMYGHGLLGSAREAAGGVQRTTAADLCAVFVGTDMRGMSTPDLPVVGSALTDMNRADEVMEVLAQGVVNHVTLSRAMRTSFAERLFVDPASGDSLVDPARTYYYGLSQGGIMGTTVMAYEPVIRRAVLGVGGANYSTLLERSTDWGTFRAFLASAFPDPLDIVLAVNLFQMRWDRTEGSGVANSVLAGTATGVPPKQLLMQIALGDQEVPNLGSYWQARTMGIPVLGPTPVEPWGLTVQPSPLPGGSALVIMDGGAPPPPAANLPPEDHDMHNLTRRQPATRRQIKEFFETGRIVNECAGACRCQLAACD